MLPSLQMRSSPASGVRGWGARSRPPIPARPPFYSRGTSRHLPDHRSMSKLRTLYPATKPYRSGWLRVSPEHEIYWEECGNPQGKPAVFVHGGPGAGAGETSRRFFDPRKVPHRAVRPARLRPQQAARQPGRQHHLAPGRGHGGAAQASRASSAGWCSAARGARRWRSPTRRRTRSASPSWCCAASSCCATGRSTGSTSTAPARCSRTTGRTTSRRSRGRERGDLVGAYYRRLTSRSRAVQLKAAKAWAEWEAATSYLLVNEQNIASWNADDFAIAVARIECHYFVNQGFFERDDQLLRGVRRIRHIPAVIVQGRYDVVCPMRSAWDLHRAWPEADFRVVAGCRALGAGSRQHPRTGVGHRPLRDVTLSDASRARLRAAAAARPERFEAPRDQHRQVARHRLAQDGFLAVLGEQLGFVEAHVAQSSRAAAPPALPCRRARRSIRSM